MSTPINPHLKRTYQPFDGCGGIGAIDAVSDVAMADDIDAGYAERRKLSRRDDDRREIAFAATCRHLRTMLRIWQAFAVFMVALCLVSFAYQYSQLAQQRAASDSIYQQMRTQSNQFANWKIAHGFGDDADRGD